MSKDWITYLIKKIFWYMETPKTERKVLKKANKLPWSVQWFGMIPFSMKMVVDEQREKRKQMKRDRRQTSDQHSSSLPEPE